MTAGRACGRTLAGVTTADYLPAPIELPDGAVIRDARIDDVPAILGLIHELAVYEREPDAVRVTVDQLREDLFAADHYANAIVLEHDGVVVGTAVWFPIYSTWEGRSGYLEDLYVQPASRGAGYGRALLSALAGIGVARGWARLQWVALDWNEPAINFYRALGAETVDGWTTFRLTGEALAAVADLSNG